MRRYDELTDRQRAYFDDMARQLGPTMPEKSRYAPLEDLRERVSELEQRVAAMARPDAHSALYDQNGEVKCNYPHTVAPNADEARQFLKRCGYGS